MEAKMIGNDFPGVSITLNKGESVFTQSGGMAWMQRDIKMETSTRGGLLKGLARTFTGESLFMATYTAEEDNREITFSSSFPGEIMELNLNEGKQFICQKDAFLVGATSVTLETVFTKRFSAGLFGGEGFILQKISGQGLCVLESAGTIVEKTLAKGEELLVDTGNIVAFEENMTYSIETVKGIKNVLFGGEGLLLTKIVGPGTVYLQTLTVGNVASKIIPYIPTK